MSRRSFLVKTGVNDGRNNLPLSKKEFSPRLGFAYGLDQKTVIRGGYGIFFIPNYVSFGTNPYIDPVSSATSPFFASNDKGLTPAATVESKYLHFAGTECRPRLSRSGTVQHRSNPRNGREQPGARSGPEPST